MNKTIICLLLGLGIFSGGVLAQMNQVPDQDRRDRMQRMDDRHENKDRREQMRDDRRKDRHDRRNDKDTDSKDENHRRNWQ